MGIDIPTLDDREYAEIIEDARRRLPAYSEAWTDHNVTDPGVTILELLAWLSETYIYQLDQITEAHRRKYVKLMGEQVRPPQPARVNLEVQPLKSCRRVAISKGTPLKAKEESGKTRTFETIDDAIATQAHIDRVISESEQGQVDNTTANATPGMHFLAFGRNAEQGCRLYIGFTGDPFVKRSEEDPIDATEMDDHLKTGTLALTVDFHEDDLPSPTVHGGALTGYDDPIVFSPSVDLVWQYCSDDSELPKCTHWEELSVQKDGTDCFYHGGTIHLERPADWDCSEGQYLWIRCIVENSGYEIPPPLTAIRINVVAADQHITISDEQLQGVEGQNRTTALPGQIFTFQHAPVLEAAIEIDDESWTRTTDFDTSQPEDRHYVLDEERGIIQFGDGIRAMIPPPGNAVRAREYTSGGGADGNMSEAASWSFSPQDVPVRGSRRRFQIKRLKTVSVSATGPATGGTNAESVGAVLKRIRKDQTSPYRAVSLEDYQAVAMTTPGLRFGRAIAHVVSRQIGDERLEEIRVVVVPYSTTKTPTPSTGFLEAVQEHLDYHRLLTDRVKVAPPKYVGIGVDAEIRIDPGYSVEERITVVANRLDEFLHPLRGFETAGWPFGRSLYRSELYEAIESVAGVESVLDIGVRTRNEQAVDSQGTVSIDETALLSPLDHNITARIDSAGERKGDRR